MAVVLITAACSQPPSLKGTDLGREPAPDFQLVDQDGQPTSLSSFKGRPVVLTFLYTHCPDVCPLIADHLRTAMEQLGSAADKTAFLAISADPEHDTPEAIAAFDRQHRLGGRLRFLNGPRQQLEPVWKANYVDSEVDPSHPESIAHSTRVILIDKNGRQRINLDGLFDPPDLVSDLQILFAE